MCRLVAPCTICHALGVRRRDDDLRPRVLFVDEPRGALEKRFSVDADQMLGDAAVPTPALALPICHDDVAHAALPVRLRKTFNLKESILKTHTSND